MNFKEILELIDKVADRGIGALEIEQAGVKLRIEGKHAQPHIIQSYAVGEMRNDAPMLPGAPLAAVQAAHTPAALPFADAESDPSLHVITSPIVGTFYRSANPEAEAFVNVGDRVSQGQVLCIVEAMKLMNEIESDVDGVVVHVYPQNAQPVEYGERLFAVKL
ncbi:MAG TPA: acetyl-CoA carboxylase biotin carboxyl carrier protein [Thermoanaerobaculia bacterium]|nr:acetyl-CoA carboxylase biotin carboxyl carrier protein [Thermoanaerobaculia bacterium]